MVRVNVPMKFFLEYDEIDFKNEKLYGPPSFVIDHIQGEEFQKKIIDNIGKELFELIKKEERNHQSGIYYLINVDNHQYDSSKEDLERMDSLQKTSSITLSGKWKFYSDEKIFSLRDDPQDGSRMIANDHQEISFHPHPLPMYNNHVNEYPGQFVGYSDFYKRISGNPEGCDCVYLMLDITNKNIDIPNNFRIIAYFARKEKNRSTINDNPHIVIGNNSNFNDDIGGFDSDVIVSK